jgi:hypothetical protein
MAIDPVANFPFSTVATAPSPATSGGSLVVAAGGGASFPSAGGFNAIICPVGVQPTATNAEVVRVTVISTDTFTITRAQETSTARTVLVGDQIFLSITAKMLTDLAGGVPINLTAQSVDPAAPAAGLVTFYSKAIAGRVLPKIVGPSRIATALQPFLARNKVGYWCPPGNSTTVPGVFGFTPYTVVGTATARNVSTTNGFNRMRRMWYLSSTVAASFASPRVAVAQVSVADGANGFGSGGFYKVIRFGCSDAATVSGARQFCGVGSVNAATNVEPSTLTNSIGVGHGAADTNLKMYFGGSVAQTPIDLGVNFPANTLSVDAYELAIFSPPNSQNVYWEVTRLNTGNVASGTITNTTPGTTLPAATTLLSYSQNWRCNNATALAVGLDIMSDYIETDN